MALHIEPMEDSFMLRLLMADTSPEGHTASITERLAATARPADCAVEVCEPARSRPE